MSKQQRQIIRHYRGSQRTIRIAYERDSERLQEQGSDQLTDPNGLLATMVDAVERAIALDRPRRNSGRRS
jgi:hypothetical protein